MAEKILKQNHGWTIGVLHSIINEYQRVISQLENEGEVSISELRTVLSIGQYRSQQMRQILDNN